MIKRLLFVGLGGAGQRHLRIFQEKLGASAEYFALRTTRKTPLLNKDFTVNETAAVEGHYGLTSFSTREEAFQSNPDLVVISTPTSTHMDFALDALRAGAHLLVEKPFSHNLDQFQKVEQLAREKNLAVKTSFQRRYNPCFAELKKLLASGELGQIHGAHFNVYSYVPHWHKYEDFRDLYACRKDLGGGALLTEIHEVDLCYWYFGLPDSVYCRSYRITKDELDVEDSARLVLNYPTFSVTLSICFMEKSTQRDFHIKAERAQVEWSETSNKLTITSSESGEVAEHDGFGMNEMFEAQAADLLDSDLSYSASDLETAIASVKMITAAKRSDLERREVRIDEL